MFCVYPNPIKSVTVSKSLPWRVKRSLRGMARPKRRSSRGVSALSLSAGLILITLKGDLSGLEDLTQDIVCFPSSFGWALVLVFRHDTVSTDREKERFDVIWE